MSFAKPVFLYLLLFLPLLFLLLLWAERRRAWVLARLGEPHLIQQLTSSLNRSARRWKSMLWFAALALLLFALARPQWGSRIEQVEQSGLQIMVVLDVSRSMLAQDIQPDRLSRARLEIAEMMNRLDGDEIGLVLFAGASFIQFPLTNDYATARSFLDASSPDAISHPGTAIGEALHTAINGFDPERSSQQVILLISDGEDHSEEALSAARLAAEKGILIYAIGFGSTRGEPIPEFNASGEMIGYKKDTGGEIVLSRLNETHLMEIAETAGGQYYHAGAAGNELDALLGEINKLQSAAYNTRFETQAIERFQFFLLPALAILLAAEIIPERKQPGDKRLKGTI